MLYHFDTLILEERRYRRQRSDRPHPYNLKRWRAKTTAFYTTAALLSRDESLILTFDQYQEGGWEKKAKKDADGTIDLFRDEIQGLQVEKRRASPLAAASTAEDFEAEVHSLKCAIKDLEADKASLIADKAALEAKISILEGCLLAAAEEKEEVRALQAKAKELEMKVRDLTEELRLSKEQAKEAVEEQVRIGTAWEEELEQVIKALEDIRTLLEEGAHWIQYRQESWRE